MSHRDYTIKKNRKLFKPPLDLFDTGFVGNVGDQGFVGTVVQVRFGRYNTWGFSRIYYSPSTDSQCYGYGQGCYNEVFAGTLATMGSYNSVQWDNPGTVSNFTSLVNVKIPDSDPEISVHDLFGDATYWGTNSGNMPGGWKITVTG